MKLRRHRPLPSFPPSGRITTTIFSDFLRSSIHFANYESRRVYGRRILAIREVAELLKINEKTAYKLALAREIPGFKVGGPWRFERQAIANWIKRKVEEQ